MNLPCCGGCSNHTAPVGERAVCKRVVLTNAQALTCWFLCLSPPHPHACHPCPSFSTRTTTPHHPPQSDPKPLLQGHHYLDAHFAKPPAVFCRWPRLLQGQGGYPNPRCSPQGCEKCWPLKRQSAQEHENVARVPQKWLVWQEPASDLEAAQHVPNFQRNITFGVILSHCQGWFWGFSGSPNEEVVTSEP